MASLRMVATAGVGAGIAIGCAVVGGLKLQRHLEQQRAHEVALELQAEPAIPLGPALLAEAREWHVTTQASMHACRPEPGTVVQVTRVRDDGSIAVASPACAYSLSPSQVLRLGALVHPAHSQDRPRGV